MEPATAHTPWRSPLASGKFEPLSGDLFRSPSRGSSKRLPADAGGETEPCVSQDDDDLSRRIDRHVGGRVRRRRKRLGPSQAWLSAALGVSVQPVQICERGANRLSAAKRVALAEALDAPLACFLDGLGAGDAPQSDVRPQGDERLQAFWLAADAGDFLRALSVLESLRLRRELLDLIRSMADEA